MILRLQVGSVFTTSDADLGADLDPDHRLLLRFVEHRIRHVFSLLLLCSCSA